MPKLKEIAKANIDLTTVKIAKFDGTEISNTRVVSPTFDYTLPEENSLYDYFGQVGPQFEGRIKPVVSDGWWASIPPPTPGLHTVEIISANSAGFSLNITYTLTVA